MAPKLNEPIPEEMFFQVAAAIYVLYREGVTTYFELSHVLGEPLNRIQEVLVTSGNLEDPLFTVFNQMKEYGVQLSFKEKLELDMCDSRAIDSVMEGFFETLQVTLDGDSELEMQSVLYDWERDHQIISDEMLDLIMVKEWGRLIWEDDVTDTELSQEQLGNSEESTFEWPDESELESWDTLKSSMNTNIFNFDSQNEESVSDAHNECTPEELLMNHSFSFEEIEVLNETVSAFINREKACRVYYQLRYLVYNRLTKCEMSIREIYQELETELQYASYLVEDRIDKVRSMLFEIIHYEKREGRIAQFESGELCLTNLGYDYIEQLSLIALDAVGILDDMDEILINLIAWNKGFRVLEPYSDNLLLSYDTFNDLADWYMEHYDL